MKKSPLFTAVLLVFLSSVFVLKVQAADLPWKSEKYTHYSEEEPLVDMLESLASAQGTSIVISTKIDDVVSAYYREMYPLDILEALSKAHKLMWYYDGEVLYVYKNDEVQTGSVTLKTISVSEFSETLRKLGILDDQFYWNEVESESIVNFKGPERFVSSVLIMAKELDNKKPGKNKVYKWRDANGRVNYSNQNPEKGSASLPGKVIVLTKDNLFSEDQ